ncbi:ATP-dependent DNA helicase DinG [Photorhabdus luminescens]|uniref:ATP-dependent DNA helicase DinG n=1 Tax=Photorhabdus luminescens subsp. mexicana TaxID=2100167 RepID=A0A4R4IWK5_PHOLU|nr:ATP-dependent DNA helicase DinG [Photorhabdus luminescens]TDB45317.1 ATP-dependent DNA helicase DinG [Photorhabdus luminescens subsp. mexicana]
MSTKNPKLTAAEQVTKSYSTFLESKGLTTREGQKEMMNFCFSLINGIPDEESSTPYVGVVEAGTGTGKTLGYCLPLILLAKEKGKTLILSTATVALQEQIINKDLPEIQTKARLNFTYAMAKGRGRYFCRMRCEAHMNNEINAYGYVREDVNSLHHTFDAKKWNGEKDSYPKEIQDKTWSKVNSIASQCLKQKCPHFATCPFFNARRQMEQVDVIIANHDIILSDLSLGGGVILPIPEEVIYVFDEGHHITNKAIEHFAADVSLDHSARFMGEVTDMVMMLPKFYGDKMKKHVYSLEKNASVASAKLLELRNTLLCSLSFRNEIGNVDIYRFPEGDVPVNVRELFKPIRLTLNEMNNLVDKMTVIVDETGNKMTQEDMAQHKMTVGELSNRLESMINAIRNFVTERRNPDAMPIARWVNVKRDNKSEVVIHSSPVHAGEQLHKELWSKAFGVIVTSATIRSMGSFDSFLNKAGLAPTTPTLLASSPFDYENNGVLFVPKMRSTPNNQEAHTAEICELLPKLVLRRKGCLVLFSSRKQMTEVHENMPEKVKQYILMQGTLSKREIIKRHKLRIDRGEQSVIFGMASFSEGVDLPGDYCDNVVIAKLPFSVPTDPVSQTMSEWMKKIGRDTFAEITVPDTCIKLVQAVGRLIRTETDTGAVTILDTRIKFKNYGKNILNSLPPFRRVIR